LWIQEESSCGFKRKIESALRLTRVLAKLTNEAGAARRAV
jgi:hypothetical protein